MKNTFKNISLSLLLLSSISFADTMHENASDGDTVGWHIYDRWPSGASLDNVIDNETGNRVIKITGTTSNGVQFLGWHDTNSILQWKMKADAWNVFYIAVMTSNGARYLSCTPRDYDVGHDPYHQSHKIRLGLKSEMMDGEWHTFKVDIQEKLTEYEPGNQLEYIQGIKIRGAGSYDDIKTISNSKNINDLENIFIIGPSTVHAGGYVHDTGALAGFPLEGWGEKLGEYAKDSSKVINRARSGANPATYISDIGANSARSHDIQGRWWPDTLSKIQNTPDKDNDFLLIQFGGNSSKDEFAMPWQAREPLFKERINFIIAKAKSEGLIPVLISSLSSRTNWSKSRANFPKYMKELAIENNLLFLDLYTKSFNEYKNIFESVGLAETIDENAASYNINELEKIYSYERDTRNVGGINNTHLSPAGAKIIAGWVKELACEQSNTSDVAERLCAQFK